MHNRRIRCVAATVAIAISTLWSCASPGGATADSETEQATETSEANGDGTAGESTADDGESTRPAVDAPSDFEVLAHRGARALKPENTLPSVEAALDTRPDHIEIDLHLSKDGRLVVWHDPFIRSSKCRRPEAGSDENGDSDRQLPEPTTLEKRRESAKVRNLTADQLRAYQCDRNPKPEAFPDQNSRPTALAGDDFGIVTLEEFFEFVRTYTTSETKTEAQRRNARNVGLFLEIKRHLDHPSFIDDGFDGSGPAVMEKKLVSAVRDHEVVDRTTVLADRPVLWAVADLESDIDLAVAETERRAPLSSYADRGVTYWMPNAEMVDESDVRDGHEADLRVVPWTVNDPAEIERLIELGSDGILTDAPNLFRAGD